MVTAELEETGEREAKARLSPEGGIFLSPGREPWVHEGLASGWRTSRSTEAESVRRAIPGLAPWAVIAPGLQPYKRVRDRVRVRDQDRDHDPDS